MKKEYDDKNQQQVEKKGKKIAKVGGGIAVMLSLLSATAEVLSGVSANKAKKHVYDMQNIGKNKK